MTTVATTTELHVLKVFAGPDGRGGNPLGVFLEGWRFAAERRQAVAADLAFSETVFVDDPAEGAIRIFTPAAELAFAGHPTVGTAYVLARTGIIGPSGSTSTSVAGSGASRTWNRSSGRGWASEASTSGRGSTSRRGSFEPATSRPTTGSSRTRRRGQQRSPWAATWVAT